MKGSEMGACLEHWRSKGDSVATQSGTSEQRGPRRAGGVGQAWAHLWIRSLLWGNDRLWEVLRRDHNRVPSEGQAKGRSRPMVGKGSVLGMGHRTSRQTEVQTGCEKGE